MLQAPTTEPKVQSEASRPPLIAEPQRLLHPRFSGVTASHHDGRFASGSPSNGDGFQQQFSRLQRRIGNQGAILRLSSANRSLIGPNELKGNARTGLAIQCSSSTTAISTSGTEVPELSVPSSEPDTSNLEDPSVALAEIEGGTPAGVPPDSPSGPANGAPQKDDAPSVQASSAPGRVAPRSVSPKAVLARIGSGEPMQASLRTHMETAMGHDFSQVRVHNSPTAAGVTMSLGAHALTVGEHIAFAPGLYEPHLPSTRRLVAHELAHVVQQRRGLSGQILRRGIGTPGDAYEQEAEAVAESVSRGSRSLPRNESRPVASGAEPNFVQCFSGSAAAAYAHKWATGRNPSYVSFDDDCTNFASQAMEAGGWTQIVGADICDDRKKDSVWWFKKGGCTRIWPLSDVDASFTWGGAENFRRFIGSSGRATAAAKITDLDVGDVLQRDHGDGTIHHTMVVTQKGTDTDDKGTSIVQIWLSYHTNDTLDRKFWGKGNILDTTPAGWNYFAWKVK